MHPEKNQRLGVFEGEKADFQKVCQFVDTTINNVRTSFISSQTEAKINKIDSNIIYFSNQTLYFSQTLGCFRGVKCGSNRDMITGSLSDSVWSGLTMYNFVS